MADPAHLPVELTFLGTGTSQGVPIIGCTCEVCQSLDARDKRLRTSALVRAEGLTIVIDPGPDFRQQMLRARPHRIDAILLTHEHKDHTGGLDDIRAFNYMQGEPIPLYTQPRVAEHLRQEYAYIFKSNYPGIPRVELVEVGNEPFQIKGLTITPILVSHAKLPVQGYRIGDVCYITDANAIAEEELAKTEGAKLLVLNALQREPHISHFTLAEAIAVAQRINAPRTYFTHMAHRIGLHRMVEKELPSGIMLAYDTLRVSV